MSIKINRAKKLAGHLPMQQQAVWESMPQGLIASLTGAQLAAVAAALDAHWHKAQAALRASEKADGCYWVEDKLIPAEALRAIKIEHAVERTPREPSLHFPATETRWSVTRYSLDFVERV